MTVVLAAAKRKAEIEHEGRAWLAIQIENVGRMKRLPSIDKLIGKAKATSPQRPQSGSEVLAVMRALKSRIEKKGGG